MSRKRSKSFRGVQNAPPRLGMLVRKDTGLDPSLLAATQQTIKESIAERLATHQADLDVPRRFTADMLAELETMSQELLELDKSLLASYVETDKGMRILLTALAYYTYFDKQEVDGLSLQESEFHVKCVVDDILYRLLASKPNPKSATTAASAGASGANSRRDTVDPWADF
eukprot:TRINITY_DN12396_c0_g1_i1.p1 TRINITY_DN12396_c0_g1~~TRINITY_DN12396_c0_g1_i1.p1  ORF type:complete len:184 (-),score=26.73 TRINITY_DN12396_c0_g1_i1:285-797(-)